MKSCFALTPVSFPNVHALFLGSCFLSLACHALNLLILEHTHFANNIIHFPPFLFFNKFLCGKYKENIKENIKLLFIPSPIYIYFQLYIYIPVIYSFCCPSLIFLFYIKYLIHFNANHIPSSFCSSCSHSLFREVKTFHGESANLAYHIEAGPRHSPNMKAEQGIP